MRLLLCLSATLAISACATGYHSLNNPLLGMTGGYWDKPGPGQLIKVGFAGNGLIAPERVGDYLLYRCAEVTLREGGTHFLFYETLPAAVADQASSGRRVSRTAGAADAYSFILVLHADEPRALAAREVLQRLQSIVQGSQP